MYKGLPNRLIIVTAYSTYSLTILVWMLNFFHMVSELNVGKLLSFVSHSQTFLSSFLQSHNCFLSTSSQLWIVSAYSIAPNFSLSIMHIKLLALLLSPKSTFSLVSPSGLHRFRQVSTRKKKSIKEEENMSTHLTRSGGDVTDIWCPT